MLPPEKCRGKAGMATAGRYSSSSYLTSTSIGTVFQIILQIHSALLTGGTGIWEEASPVSSVFDVGSKSSTE